MVTRKIILSFEVSVSAHATGLQKAGQFMVLLAAVH